jgi:holo-[acyl-carrier protein] synthase
VHSEPDAPLPAGTPRIGLDLVRVARIATAVERSPGFTAGAYTPSELAECAAMRPRRRAEYLAGRFAVKEAVLKALAAGGAEPAALRDIETLSDVSGAPTLTLHGDVLGRARALGATRFAVSITHEGGTAAAVVLAQ